MRKLELELDDESGKITYMDDEVVLSSAGFYAFLYEAIAEEDPLLAKRILYTAGEEFAGEAVSDAQKVFIRTVGRMMKKTLVENMMNLGLERGFGVFSADPSYDFESGEGIVSVENSVVAHYSKKSLEPVCYSVAGIISGAAGIIYGTDFVCHEVMCKAKGDRTCLFSLKRASKAEKNEFLKTLKPF